MPRSLHVALAVSEVVPYVKTGGLADVAAALPKALAGLGYRLSVFVPRYASIPFPPGEFVGSLPVPVDALNRSAGFYRVQPRPGHEVIFVEYPPFFDRPWPYGEGNRDYADNRLRFAFFARAILEYFRSRGERPDVFHAHDWQAGLLPVYLKAFYWDDPTLGRVPTVFTVHNLAYQGVFPADTVGLLGLPWNLNTASTLEFHGSVSFMKGGLLFAEMVGTVSPSYAQEIQLPEHGQGLDGVLRDRSADLVGILNGVDYDEWDPRVDVHIARRYSPEALDGKAACKADLLRTFGLPEYPDLPVVGVTSRLVAQKGFDMVVQAGRQVLERPLRLVVLGSGEPEVQDGLGALARLAPDRVAVRFAYDPVLAHKIKAGADLFLMPSRYEPCGLTQMYALRYGTVPVVRATGGLIDTVEAYDSVRDSGTGFRFDHADAPGLLWALDQALALRRDAPAWRRLMLRGMGQDFSWERSARAYGGLYARAIEKR